MVLEAAPQRIECIAQRDIDVLVRMVVIGRAPDRDRAAGDVEHDSHPVDPAPALSELFRLDRDAA